MAKNVRAGGAFVELGIKSAIDKGLRQASRDMKKWGTNISKVGAMIGAAGGAVMTPLLGATAKFQEMGDKYHKMSLRMNASSESLSQLAFAAEQSGTSIDSVAAAAFRADRRIDNWAKTGSGPAARAMKLMGMEAKDFAGKNSIERMMVMADALGQIGDEAIRNQMGFEVLGDNYKDLVPLLKEGSDGMRNLMQEADALGRTMSTENAQAAADMGDALNRLKSLATGLVTQIGGALAPTITDFANSMIEGGKSVVGFVRNNRELIVTVFKIAAAVAGIGAVIAGFGAAVVAAGVVLGGLATAIAALLSPIGLVAAAIGSLAAYWFSQFDSFGEAIDWLRERFGPLVDTIQDAATIIFDALGSGDIVKAWATITDTLKTIFFDLTKGIRGYWEDAMKWLVGASAMVVSKIGELFKALADGLRSMLEKYRSYYNSVFNWVTEKIGEAGGVRTIGGPVDAAANDPIVSAAEAAIDKIGKGGDLMLDFGSALKEQGPKNVDNFFRGMEKRDKERRAKLDTEADKIRAERSKAEYERQKQNRETEQDQTRTIGALQKGAGTFSTVGAMFLGGQSVQERQLTAMEKVATNTDALVEEAGEPQIAVAGP